MSGPSFLFTRDGVGRTGGASAVRPLLRAANRKQPSFAAAVALAEKEGIVQTDGSTIQMAPDAALLMIGTRGELADELGPEGTPLTYSMVTSAEDDTTLELYTMDIKVSFVQTDLVFVLAGPKYWKQQYAGDMWPLDFNDGGGKSYALHLGHNDRRNKKDKTMIYDLLTRQ